MFVRRRIKLKHGVKTKGIHLKKGQKVVVTDYPMLYGRDFYSSHMTVRVKGYGLVSVPKTVLHKTAHKDILRRLGKRYSVSTKDLRRMESKR
jgi:hypothetical protein